MIVTHTEDGFRLVSETQFESSFLERKYNPFMRKVKLSVVLGVTRGDTKHCLHLIDDEDIAERAKDAYLVAQAKKAGRTKKKRGGDKNTVKESKIR